MPRIECRVEKKSNNRVISRRVSEWGKKIERDKRSNKQCKKEDNKEMHKKFAKREQQKAFLCSTLMKSYAFVVMLLPS